MVAMSFEANYKRLNAAQKQAVDTIEGPVLVVAGPGTGKTQLLALRAANILQRTDTAPQNILCLTYTEVGARNMRERLSSLIGQAAYDIRISTYHGFGSDIIRANAEYFSEYGNEQPVDRLGQDTILQEIFAKLPASNQLWRAESYLKDALDFIAECKNNGLLPDDIRTVAAHNKAFVEEASKNATETLQTVVKMNKSVVPAFESLLNKLAPLAGNKTIAGGVIQPLANLAVSQLNNALTAYEATGKTNELTKFKNDWLAKNSKNQWVFTGMREVNKLLGAADVFEQYNAALKAAQLYDYSDMINRAIAGLTQYDELRFSLHEQYLYVMLDEFQDTNYAQLKLVELLTNNPNAEGRPNILAVGDDDQAIFSFQGADITNMLQFTQMYKDVQVITLTENYRSHGDILHAAAGVATQIEDRLSNQLGTGEKVLAAKNESIKSATIQRQQYKSDVAQFDAVARQIAGLIKAGTPPQEIAVLAPQHRHLEPLIPYLQALDIPIRYDKRENVLDDPHVLELTAMAELITALAANDQPLADSIWPRVLSADFWELPTSTIWKLSWQSNENRYKADKEHHWQALMMEQPALKPIALFFAKLASLAQIDTLETMLDYIVGVAPLTLNEPDLAEYTSPYYDFYFGQSARANTPQEFTHTLSNLTVLRQHLREYRRTADAPLKLQDLLTFVADYHAAGEKLLNTSPYHSAQNAVQLMTAYGAKGLEFDAVFVLATQDDVWGMGARGKSSNITLPPNLQIIRRAGSTKDEKKRLFYVAITRAKHSLFLTGYSQNYAGKNTTALEFLAEADGKVSILPPKHRIILENSQEVLEQEALQHFWTTRHAPLGIQQPDLRELVLPRLEDFQLSATHLNSFTDLVYGGPDAFFINTVLRFPKAPTADGQYGNAMHETLESLQHHLRREGELPDVDEAIKIFTEKLKLKRLSQNDFSRQHERGALALKAFIPQWWHNFTPDAETEKDFKHEGVFVGAAHLSGKLDQLLVDTEQKSIRVVDFKTGKSHAKWTREVKMHKYKQQLLFYKLSVENSHSYKGYDVEQGSLVFVEPDDDGIINELSLPYTTADLERTKKLINAIWHRIKKLDFPDISEYSADLKGIEAFEDWLIENA